jgi:hypothetical protein
MKFEPVKLWKPGDDIWDLCDEGLGEQISLKGIFTPDLLCAKSGELILRGIAPNTMLKKAVRNIFDGANPRISFFQMAVGDNGTPTDPEVDQGLKHMISIANGMVGGPSAYTLPAVSLEDYGWSYTAYWPSQAGNGELAEVAMYGSGTPTYGYLNRALFLDDLGNQITIPKDNGHVMRITCQFQFRVNRV